MRYNAFFGELPINAFKPIGGRMTLEGGGNPISAVTDAVSNVVSGAVDTVGNIGQAGIDVTKAALEPAVEVGKWSVEHPLEAAALGAGAYYGLPALMGETGAAGSLAMAPESAAAYDAGLTGVGSNVGALEANTAFTGALPAGSAYAAPSVTPLSTLASTEAGAGLGGTALADMGGAQGLQAGGGLGLTGAGAEGLTLPTAAAGADAAGLGAGLGGAALGADLAGINTGASALGGAGLANSLTGSTLGDLALIQGGTGLATSLLGANAASNAADVQSAAAQKALEQQQANFNLINQQQTPYRAAGAGALSQLGALGTGNYTQYDASGNPIGTGTGSGYLQHQFNAQDLAAGLAPNYDFMLQQGQMANQRAANAGGGALGGNAMQGLQKYTQDYAGNAYQNAFTNYQNQRSNIYNTLAGIAGIGQTGQTATNAAGTNLANAASQLGVGSAAAQAAGGVGSATAYGNALSGLGNTLTLATLLGQKGTVA